VTASAALTWIRLPKPTATPRTIHLNTSSNGGGVSEILNSITTHANLNDVATGWGVLGATKEFFDFTKNLHHLIHGQGSPERLTSPSETDVYRRTLADVLPALLAVLRPTDTVILHDPQTLGLAPALREHVRSVYWQCHIGSMTDSRQVKEAVWAFFVEDLATLDGILVADRAYVSGALASRVIEICPATWSLSPKNAPLSRAEIDSRLDELGLFGAGATSNDAGRLWQTHLLPHEALAVLQVSRWDPLKGMSNVLRTLEGLDDSIHLVLAGPDPKEVLDDPEGSEQLAETLQVWDGLPARVRQRAHVVALSSRDSVENALRVNALQRRADIVTQRSLEEGFGLTVTEAMLKEKPVVASRTGGLAKQIQTGQNGILVDPLDDSAFITSVNALARDAKLRTHLGRNAALTATQRYSLERLVGDYNTLTITTNQRA